VDSADTDPRLIICKPAYTLQTVRIAPLGSDGSGDLRTGGMGTHGASASSSGASGQDEQPLYTLDSRSVDTAGLDTGMGTYGASASSSEASSPDVQPLDLYRLDSRSVDTADLNGSGNIDPIDVHKHSLRDFRRDDLQLDFSMQDNQVRIAGGKFGDRVALLIGFEQAYIPLPGAAILRLVPLAIVSQGVFNANGEFKFTLPMPTHDADGEAASTSPMKIYLQALSVRSESQSFVASDMLALDYRPPVHTSAN
jgi:hypothetical protein